MDNCFAILNDFRRFYSQKQLNKLFHRAGDVRRTIHDGLSRWNRCGCQFATSSVCCFSSHALSGRQVRLLNCVCVSFRSPSEPHAAIHLVTCEEDSHACVLCNLIRISHRRCSPELVSLALAGMVVVAKPAPFLLLVSFGGAAALAASTSPHHLKSVVEVLR